MNLSMREITHLSLVKVNVNSLKLTYISEHNVHIITDLLESLAGY